MKNTIISIENLTKRYGDKEVLKGVNLNVEAGTIFALLGENGAGKTTTVKILSTLIRADNGVAKIGGIDVNKKPREVKKIISLTGQYASVDELLTGKENMEMMGKLYHLSNREIRTSVNSLLNQFDLISAAKKQVKDYSGGMRRKLDLAISLLSQPKVLFLDEPTTGLDPRSRLSMWKSIQELAKNGVTIFLTTQYLDEADKLADKIAVIDGGMIVEEGTADELKSIVGEDTLGFTFKNEQLTTAAMKLIGGEEGDTPYECVLTSEESVELLRETLNVLHQNMIEVEKVNIRKPTLDDVFMHTTKRSEEK